MGLKLQYEGLSEFVVSPTNGYQFSILDMGYHASWQVHCVMYQSRSDLQRPSESALDRLSFA